MHCVRPLATASVLAFAFAISGNALAAGPVQAAQAAKPAAAATTATGDPVVVMKTSMGEIQIKLYQDKAPVSVANFLAYVNKRFYDGTIFHRIIPTFMVQGGGFTADMTKKPTAAPIKIESQNGLKNTRGTVAMARTADPNSATAQFFINVVDNAGLDYPKPDGHGYAVFGEVIAGMDVVDKIKAVPTTVKAGMRDVPVDAVTIESVRLAGK
jgi:peptidyl-prolyl cis-trans isomerase A (cyclophilin A)